MSRIIALVLCFLTGSIAFIGMYISIKTEKIKLKIPFLVALNFSFFLAFIVLYLIPNSYLLIKTKLIGVQSFALVILLMMLGYFMCTLIKKYLKIDKYLYVLKNIKSVNYELFFSILLFNLMSGMNIFLQYTSSNANGIVYALKIGVYNMILGYIFNSLNKDKNKNVWIYLMSYIGLSTLLGGFLTFIASVIFTKYVIGILLAINTGMFLYMLIHKFYLEYKSSKNEKTRVITTLLVLTVLLAVVLI